MTDPTECGLIEMHDPQGVILRELEDHRITQASVALTYAFCMRQLGDRADWPAINAAIQRRWKGRTALTRIKEMAWKRLEGK